MQIKEKVLDRIEESFNILIGDKNLLVWIVGIYIGISIISKVIILFLFNQMIIDSGFFLHKTNYVIMFFYFIYFLFLIFLNIGIYLGVIKYLNLVHNGETPDIKKSLIFGMNNIINSFYTYYYIFIYVWLIP
ncbi:hypothetical protein KAZ01_02965, partial [Candidatus Gracilibacteria bacterium]|nr:hypothetical protein [Candidatus Gracilibacteria bacterium]